MIFDIFKRPDERKPKPTKEDVRQARGDLRNTIQAFESQTRHVTDRIDMMTEALRFRSARR